MTHEWRKYHLVVHPGILDDGTYGIYATPCECPQVEYQLRGRFDSAEEAREFASAYQQFAPESIIGSPEVRDDRKIQLPAIGVSDSEPSSVQALRRWVESLMSAPSGFKKRLPWARLSAGTPYLFSFVAMACYLLNLTVTLPKEVPLLGEYLGGERFSPERIAGWFPFVLVALVLIMQVRVRQSALKYADIRDHVLYLAIEHGWRREQFVKLLQDVIRSKGFGWLRKYYQWVRSWDPDTVNGVTSELSEKLAEHSDEEKLRREFAELFSELNDEDFEFRVHALYCLSREPSFRPWLMIVPPLQMLMSNRRAIRRAQYLLRFGLENGLVFLDLAALPGRDDHRINRRLFPFIAAWPVLTLGGALLWSFLKSPWTGAPGWVGMATCFILVLAPILHWNYNLIVKWRGLPRGMAWVDLEAPMKLIRAL